MRTALPLCTAALALFASAPAATAVGPPGGLDARVWELVSPVAKNGGRIATPTEAGVGAFRAAAQGGAVAFASAASFGQAQGAAPFSQYIATRGPAGWSTENITPAHLSTAYAGDPFVAFSADLSHSLYLNPAVCPAGDPCLAGYQLRDNLTGDLVPTPDNPGLFAGASANLRHVGFFEGGNLYLWSPGAAPTLIATSVDSLPAAKGAVSDDGARVYWRGADANLYLRAGADTIQVDAIAGGAGHFEAASADGSLAFFTKDGHLHRYDAMVGMASDITPAGGVTAVLGASADGQRLYYRTAAALFVWRAGQGAQQVGGSGLADVSPEGSGVSADGLRLFFTTANALVGADTNKAPDAYQWSAPGAAGCAKASGCTGLLSDGKASAGATFLDASADGADAYFLTVAPLVAADADGALDLYDARSDGGFVALPAPIPCAGDACQGPAFAPEDLSPATMAAGGRGNVSPAKARRATRRCAKAGRTAHRPRSKAARRCKHRRGKR